MRAALFAFFSLFLIASQLQAREALHAYVLGNSLIHHKTESDTTAAPYWMGWFARESGKVLAVDGQWTLLRDAPEHGVSRQWGIDGAESRWGAARLGAYEVLIFNPENFIQYSGPEAPYPGDNPDGRSPISAALGVIDAAHADNPKMRFVLYEGWPDITPFGRGFRKRFPPNARGMARYHAHTKGDFRDWYVSMIDQLHAARPGLDLTLLPVGPVLADVLTGPLAELPPEVFYADDSPHGTPTLYMLAGAVMYAALFEAPLPRAPLPALIDPEVRARWDAVARVIETALERQAMRHARPGQTLARASQPAPERLWTAAAPLPTPKAEVPAGVGLDNPALAMGLGAINDWTTQHPFINHMKTARPWIGHSHDKWGAFSTEALIEGGHLSATGDVLSFPKGATKLESLVLTDLPENDSSVAGRYHLRYEGEGAIRVIHRAQNTRYDYPNKHITFDFTPGLGPVTVQLRKVDPENPIRNITLVHEDQLDLHEAGAIFNPEWTTHIADMRRLRFMDWMFTNGSDIAHWGERPLPEDASYVWRGVPIEVMVQLANELGADPWFTMPHLSDDTYNTRFAELVLERLDPERQVWVEYSNETWNFIFPQTHWARDKATARWGAEDKSGWMQYAGMRAAEVMRLWSTVFAEAPDRLVRVAGVHTGWRGLEESFFQAPLYVAEDPATHEPPVTAFDAYAVTGYFGSDLGNEDQSARITDWIETSRSVAEANAAKLPEEERAAATEKAAYAVANQFAAAHLRDVSLPHLTDELWPYHAKVARDLGLRLVMYEGGTHITGHGLTVDNETLTNFFIQFNYSPEMAALYKDALSAWRKTGDAPFNAFVDVIRASKWGSWGALRTLSDKNPRWDQLRAETAAPLAGSRARSFQHGVTRTGSGVIEGTARIDTLLGGPEDDLLVSYGGADRLHGGEGTDVALLPGARDDWHFRTAGPRIVGDGPEGRVLLTQIETIRFAAALGTAHSLAELVE